MILYGVSAQESVVLLFVAGIVPGLIMALLMATYIYAFAVRRGIREASGFSFRKFLAASREGVWALGMPVIILGGIYAGIFSPTEAAGIACVYAIVVTRFIYGDIGWKGIWEVSVNSMYLTAQVLIIVAAAGVFSQLLTISGAPQSAVATIRDMNLPPWMALLAINIFLLFVGCLLDPASAILVLTPLLAPIAVAIGVDLIHFGIIMTVNLAIGMFTPPFGLNIFVSQALFKAPPVEHLPGAGAVHHHQYRRAADRHLRPGAVAVPDPSPGLTLARTPCKMTHPTPLPLGEGGLVPSPNPTPLPLGEGGLVPSQI